MKDFAPVPIDAGVTAEPVVEELIPTRESLLARIRDPGDGASWREFYDTYWRLIVSVARKKGLNDAEAQDAAQETLVAVARHIGAFRYEPERCSFKSWLLMIARQRIIQQLRKRPAGLVAGDGVSAAVPAGEGSGRTATVERVPDPESLNLDSLWDDEWRRNLLAAAVERIKGQVSARQFQIFELSTLQEWPVREIARTLQISAAQVYLARHRVGGALKREVRRMEARMAEAVAKEGWKTVI